MGKKYVMTGSFLDGFKASFTKKECILAEKHYPLGYFAVEFLEVDRTLLRELERLVPIFQEELTVFLSARDPSSAALAQQALNAVGCADPTAGLSAFRAAQWPCSRTAPGDEGITRYCGCDVDAWNRPQ